MKSVNVNQWPWGLALAYAGVATTLGAVAGFYASVDRDMRQNQCEMIGFDFDTRDWTAHKPVKGPIYIMAIISCALASLFAMVHAASPFVEKFRNVIKNDLFKVFHILATIFIYVTFAYGISAMMSLTCGILPANLASWSTKIIAEDVFLYVGIGLVYLAATYVNLHVHAPHLIPEKLKMVNEETNDVTDEAKDGVGVMFQCGIAVLLLFQIGVGYVFYDANYIHDLPGNPPPACLDAEKVQNVVWILLLSAIGLGGYWAIFLLIDIASKKFSQDGSFYKKYPNVKTFTAVAFSFRTILFPILFILSLETRINTPFCTGFIAYAQGPAAATNPLDKTKTWQLFAIVFAEGMILAYTIVAKDISKIASAMGHMNFY